MTVRELIQRTAIPGVDGTRLPDQIPGRPPVSPSFAETLQKAGRNEEPGKGFTISAHAEQRISQRDIGMDNDARSQISNAFGKLEEKGAQNALLLRKDAAFVVNVPARTIITAMNQEDMQHRVFTQIDSTLLL